MRSAAVLVVTMACLAPSCGGDTEQTAMPKGDSGNDAPYVDSGSDAVDVASSDQTGDAVDVVSSDQTGDAVKSDGSNQDGETVICTDPRFADCDHDPSNGCETMIDGNAMNCGGCNVVCTALGYCMHLSCCDPGFLDCDQDPSNGCEVNGATDPLNCNGCFQDCPAKPHAEPACSNYKCVLGPCLSGYSDCNGLASDGCETPGSCP